MWYVRGVNGWNSQFYKMKFGETGNMKISPGAQLFGGWVEILAKGDLAKREFPYRQTVMQVQNCHRGWKNLG